MKIKHQNFFLLRTPLLSLNELEAFNTRIKQEGADVFEHLADFFSNPALKEAIFVASPELHQEFEKYLATGTCSKRAKEKLQSTLLKYLIRSCTRATPYGLFAGCTAGLPAVATNIELNEIEQHVRYRRLDTNYLSELSEALLKTPLIADNTKYFTNTSVYAASDKYRYAEYSMHNGMRRYNLVAVDRSPYLDALIEYAGNGAYKIELVEILEKMDIERTEAAEFIDDLVKAQLLVNELEPTVTGDDFLSALVEQLRSISGVDDITAQLNTIKEFLQQQDLSINKYMNIRQALSSLGVNTESKDLIQTDLFLSTKSRQLNENVLNQITSSIENISQVTGMAISTEMEDFKKLFIERYEEQQVPLAIALDSEIGIGYGNNKDVYATFTPLVDNIIAGNNTSAPDVRVSPYAKWQLDLYLQALRSGADEINIADDDIARLKRPNLPFHRTGYIFGSLHAKDAAAVDAGDYSFYLKNFSGSSLANLLGRFCAGNEELAQLTVQAVQQTETDTEDTVYAEIVHLPQSRLGNILARPTMRDYEIVYLGNSYLDADRKTGINDLYVSVQNNQVILHSKKLGKRVIPRLTTAHNFSYNSLPVYQFLCDLQYQQTRTGYSWSWPDALNGQVYFPRVKYRNLLLCRAHWKITLTDCNITPADAKAIDVQFSKLKERIGYLTSKLHMPENIVIVEGDNELQVDLSFPSHIELLQRILLKRGLVHLHENIHRPENCFVTQGDKKFSNEIIIPVSVESAPVIKPAQTAHVSTGDIKRSFPPGSEWQYFKIYCGTNTGERVLREVIRPLVAQLQQEQLLDKWFFIRYADPNYHIRVRFRHNGHPSFQDIVHKRLNELVLPFMEHRLVYKIQTDTYNRELERYGPGNIELIEELFYHESEFALALLECFQADDSEKARWLWALRSIDALFDATNIPLPERFKLVSDTGENFLMEFGGTHLKDPLNALYHKEQKTIEQWLRNGGFSEAPEQLYHQFSKRNQQLERIFSGGHSLEKLLPSIIHMFINRVFNAKQRKYEMVLYYFLTRFYKSQIARENRRVQ